MPRLKGIPAYVHHRASGQARVRIDGKDHYLGPYGSPESHICYDELIADLLERRKSDAGKANGSTKLNAVLAAWWTECKLRYAHNGKGRHGNAVCWRPTIRMLREALGNESPKTLTPKRLRILIEDTAKEKDWSLRYSRDVLSRVKAIYKWAAAEELIDLLTYQQLEVVTIRRGRETEPLGPVSDELVEKTLPRRNPKSICEH